MSMHTAQTYPVTRHMRLHTAPLAILLAILYLASCAPPEPVTGPEAKALATRIEAAARRKDTRPLDSLLDQELLAERITKEAGKTFSPGFKREMKQGIESFRWGAQILADGSSYHLVKAYERDNKQHLVFRLYGAGGINYHDYELGRAGSGAVRAADCYIYITGENISLTLANLFKAMMDSNDLDKGQIRSMKQMRALISQGDGERAYRLYRGLPADLRKDKAVMLTGVQIGQILPEGDPRYEQLMAAYEATYGNDAGSSLILMDGYVLRKEWAKALQAIDRLDSFINKDPLLDFYRANIYTGQEGYAKARPLLERLHRAMPDFEDGFLELIANVLITGDHARAEALMQEYQANKAMDQAKLENILLMYGAKGMG